MQRIELYFKVNEGGDEGLNCTSSRDAHARKNGRTHAQHDYQQADRWQVDKEAIVPSTVISCFQRDGDL
ncbi:hypothetical protein LSAT2_029685 [Lamellibrachia satsuma]|nr:hypothetical protein LSAT2_029685 [Lamellibrachia satsuma]